MYIHVVFGLYRAHMSFPSNKATKARGLQKSQSAVWWKRSYACRCGDAGLPDKRYVLLFLVTLKQSCSAKDILPKKFCLYYFVFVYPGVSST
jgi:hypothetical protein